MSKFKTQSKQNANLNPNQLSLLSFFKKDEEINKIPSLTKNYNIDEKNNSDFLSTDLTLSDNNILGRISLKSNPNKNLLIKNQFEREYINLNFYGQMYFPKEEISFRQYQFDIVKSCLFQNTLVCLPTGLGKTFIASVVMYNFHLWFKGKIFFLAPTRPLINQQKHSFIKIFPGIDAVEITGKQSISSRINSYSTTKIFFMTPQTLENDIKNGIFQDVDKISLLIFDEAHKTTGNYSYSNICKEIEMNQVKCRMIGLSASPGTNLEAIQIVINNLKITSIELRTENDEELKKYIFNKRIQIAEIEEQENQICHKRLIDKIINSRLEVMKKFSICDKKISVNYINMIFLLKCQDKFKQDRILFEEEYGRSMVSEIYDNFSLLFSLVNAKKLLNTHGIESFKSAIYNIETGNCKKKVKSNTYNSSSVKKQNISKARENLLKSEDFLDLKESLLIRQEIKSKEKREQLHPKLKKLNEIIKSNLVSLKSSSKAIIFTQFKDSAKEIYNNLESIFQNEIKCSVFHGQDKNFSQKDQLNIMKCFREGQIRILIATSVAEEGLDIGEVDLIICYDIASSSPIRMIQRFGRTGRKRDGVVIILAAKGEEKNKYFQCLQKLKSVNKELKVLCNGINNNNKLKLYNGEKNLYIPYEMIEKVEYFEINDEVIDNADDFLSEIDDENDEDDSMKDVIENDFNNPNPKTGNKIQIEIDDFSNFEEDNDNISKENKFNIINTNSFQTESKNQKKKLLNFSLFKSSNKLIVSQQEQINKDQPPNFISDDELIKFFELSQNESNLNEISENPEKRSLKRLCSDGNENIKMFKKN